jgi:endo-1,4-beta-D-glucanase Y
MIKTYKTSRLFTGFTILFSIIFSQEKRPFPVQLNFDNCIKPKYNQVAMDYQVSEFYKSWKSKYLKNSTNTPDGYYVYSKGTGGTGNQITISEAHGYGMIILVLMAGSGTYADPEAHWCFDGMYWFYDDHRSYTNNHLMAWDIVAGEYSPSNGSATDGDLDIAYALLLAHYQWGSSGDINYLQEAKDMIQYGIKASEVTNNRPMLGDWRNWGYASRSSDWMTDHFHAFYDHTNDGLWTNVVNETYRVIDRITANYTSTTGLMPDFVDGADPYPVSPNFLEGQYDGDYYWNACRYPWRMATDFAHYGNSKAKKACNKVLDWLIQDTNGDPDETIMAGYKLDGTPLSSNTSLAFAAPFIAACIVDKGTTNLDYQGYLDKGWYHLRINEDYDSYEASIRLLCMLLMSGNWWPPKDITGIQKEGPTPSALGNEFTMQYNHLKQTATITYFAKQSGIVSIGIYNAKGALVNQIQNNHQVYTGNNTFTVDMGSNSLSNGIYFLRLDTGEKVFNKNFRFVR